MKSQLLQHIQIIQRPALQRNNLQISHANFEWPRAESENSGRVSTPLGTYSLSLLPFRRFETGPNLRQRDHSLVCVTVGWILRDGFSVDGNIVCADSVEVRKR
jgi:hypothetical protein